jgi:NADH:ubiquinone reductase (H+-translocating)
MKASTATTRVVIAGGGFAGLYAAKEFERILARRPEIEVTLISRENFILFTPMLHEVAAGDLSPGDIVNPLRRILRRVKVVIAEVQAIDLTTRTVRCRNALQNVELSLDFDHLLFALGAETNFFETPGVRDSAVTMKNLADAALLRNRIVALLEEASLHNDEATQRELLTFVTAGGGFAGAETTGAVNDFLRETARFYPAVKPEMIRTILVHGGQYLLPELGEELGRYAERKLKKRGVAIMTGALVKSYDGSVVQVNNGTSISAATLIWTAGAKPSPVVESLACPKERGRILVDDCLAVAGIPGFWAAGDCAAVPDGTGKFYPPTAQHGMREAAVAAENIAHAIAGEPLKPFRYKTVGMLASLGHHTGVAKLFGMKFSGFVAWWMWRSVYLAKLPRLAKKLRVAMGWTLDLFFGREIEQTITARDIEATAEQIARVRARRSQTSRSLQPEAFVPNQTNTYAIR